MRAPSLLTQCLPGLLLHDRTNHTISMPSDRELPSPAVEIIPSKIIHPYKYVGENVDFHGLNDFKGKVNAADILGFTGLETVSVKSDGSLKFWEGSIDLVNVLKLEIRDGQLSLRGKRVLELGCNYGLPGIFACLKGAYAVHFHDINAETLRCITIPNVLANLEQARERQSRQPESPLTPSRQSLSSNVHFYAGEWEEVHTILSITKEGVEMPVGGLSLSFSEDDFVDGGSSHDGSITESSRQSRKLSGSRAWERASETDAGEAGYDVILIAEMPGSVSSLRKLYSLLKKCLRPPYGVIYLTVKKSIIGMNGGTKQLRALIDEDGFCGAHVVTERTDREIWKLFLKR